jgi:hypothetical protein
MNTKELVETRVADLPRGSVRRTLNSVVPSGLHGSSVLGGLD